MSGLTHNGPTFLLYASTLTQNSGWSAGVSQTVSHKSPKHLASPTRTTGYSDLIQNDTLDAVAISLPHHLHYQALREALEHRLHVLVDKPMALRRDPAEELVGRAMPVVAAQDGLHQMGVTEAAYRSARYGIPVEC